MLRISLEFPRKPTAYETGERHRPATSDVQDEFLDLKHDSAVKDLFEERSLHVFWCSMHLSYPKVSEIALRLLPFSTTYLCESGFSTLLQIKNKTRNRLDVDPDMRCA